MRIPRAVATIVVASVLAGCSNDGGAGAARGNLAELQEQAWREADQQWDRSVDRFVACMLADGFEPEEVRSWVDAIGADELPPFEAALDGLDEEQRIALTGFGFAPYALAALREAPAEDPVGPPSPEGGAGELSESFESATVECRQSAGLDEPSEAVTGLASIVAEVDERMRASDDYRRLVQEWASCMADAGFPAPTRELLIEATSVAFSAMQRIDPLSLEIAMASGGAESDPGRAEALAVDLYGSAADWESLATLEVDIALAEHGCSTALDLEARVAAVRDRLAADLETPSASS